MRIVKGEGYEVSESEYKSAVRIVRDGKVFYMFKTKRKREKNYKVIPREPLTEAMKLSKTREEMMKMFDATGHGLSANLLNYFGTEKITEIRKRLGATKPEVVTIRRELTPEESKAFSRVIPQISLPVLDSVSVSN